MLPPTHILMLCIGWVGGHVYFLSFRRIGGLHVGSVPAAGVTAIVAVRLHVVFAAVTF